MIRARTESATGCGRPRPPGAYGLGHRVRTGSAMGMRPRSGSGRPCTQDARSEGAGTGARGEAPDPARGGSRHRGGMRRDLVRGPAVQVVGRSGSRSVRCAAAVRTRLPGPGVRGPRARPSAARTWVCPQGTHPARGLFSGATWCDVCLARRGVSAGLFPGAGPLKQRETAMFAPFFTTRRARAHETCCAESPGPAAARGVPATAGDRAGSRPLGARPRQAAASKPVSRASFFSSSRACFSICRIRSRVRPCSLPTSVSVRSRPSSMP